MSWVISGDSQNLIPVVSLQFESLLGSGDNELMLETVRGAGAEFLTPSLPPPAKKEGVGRGRKRKEMEESTPAAGAQTAYAKRQVCSPGCFRPCWILVDFCSLFSQTTLCCS